jgi:hypothetical protein
MRQGILFDLIQRPELFQVLNIEKACEPLDVWSNCRERLRPSSPERYNAAMFCGRCGVHLPAEPDRERMRRDVSVTHVLNQAGGRGVQSPLDRL